MMFIYERGKGALRRKMHLCGYDPRTGDPTLVPLCGEGRIKFNTSCNLPLGQKVCLRCRKVQSEGRVSPE